MTKFGWFISFHAITPRMSTVTSYDITTSTDVILTVTSHDITISTHVILTFAQAQTITLIQSGCSKQVTSYVAPYIVPLAWSNLIGECDHVQPPLATVNKTSQLHRSVVNGTFPHKHTTQEYIGKRQEFFMKPDWTFWLSNQPRPNCPEHYHW